MTQSGRCRAAAAGAALALALALAGCSSLSFSKPDEPAVNPNIAPTNYRATVMAFLRTNPYGLVGIREAALAPPELKQFGTDSRYVVCLRAAGPDWRREKMFVFFAGSINQFVDVTNNECAGAAYQPFPELTAMLNQLKGR